MGKEIFSRFFNRTISSIVAAVSVAMLCITMCSAANYYVATTGVDSNGGTLAEPFRTITKGMQTIQNGDTLFIRGGTYRLMEENTESMNFYRAGATASNFVTIQNYNDEHITILGSLSTEGGTWLQYNANLWRLSGDFLVGDPAGMFNGAERIMHVMKSIDGTRSHGDASGLLNPGEWTRGDESGIGWVSSSTSSYIYYYPIDGEDPNAQTFELSQRKLFYMGASYMVVRGLTFAYTQNTAFNFEGGQNQLVENNVLSHNSNSNDNAYSIFISYGGGAIIRNNKVFDSMYWGGTPNSKGITFMDNDPGNPGIVENNEIYDIIGQGVTDKGGVSNLIVRNNYIHEVGDGINASGYRCNWTNPDCQKGDPEYFPGGGWKIYENVFSNNGNGVSFLMSGANSDNNGHQIYNNVYIENTVSAIDLPINQTGNVIANNIFMNNARGIYLDNGSSGTTAEVSNFLGNFESNNNLFYNNTSDYFIRPDWQGPSYSGIGYPLAEFRQTYSRENNSIIGDPLFVNLAAMDFHLISNSPAKNAGDGSFYLMASVDIGLYPSVSTNLSLAVNTIAYPVPFKAGRDRQITIANISSPAEIELYTLEGVLLFKSRAEGTSYSFYPNGIASGTYLYTVKGQNGVKRGKIVIIK